MAVHEKRAPTRLSGPRWGHSFVAAARQRLCRGACAGVEFFCGFPEDSIEMPLQGSQCCEACGDGVGGVAQIPVRRHPEARCSRKKSPDATVGPSVRTARLTRSRLLGEVANETTKCFVARARHRCYRFHGLLIPCEHPGPAPDPHPRLPISYRVGSGSNAAGSPAMPGACRRSGATCAAWRKITSAA
jgi:hypothetical protein